MFRGVGVAAQVLEDAHFGQVADLAEGHKNVAALAKSDECDRHEEVGEAQDVEGDVRRLVCHVRGWIAVEVDGYQLVDVVLVHNNVPTHIQQAGHEEEDEAPTVLLVLVAVVLSDLVEDDGAGHRARDEDDEKDGDLQEDVHGEEGFGRAEFEGRPQEERILAYEINLGVKPNALDTDRVQLQ